MTDSRDHPAYRAPSYARLFAEAGQDARRDYYNQNPELIRPGWFMGRIVKRGPEAPAMIERIDHEPGEPENKLEPGETVLIAVIAGKPANPLDVMVMYERREISEAEYRFQVADMEYAKQWAPEEAIAQPYRRVDWRKIPPVF